MKTFMSFFVFCALILGTLVSYKDWDNRQNTMNFTKIEQLNYESKIQTLSAPQGKNLVPVGAVLGVNDVNTISYSYLVSMETESDFEVIPTNVFLTKNNEIFEGENFLQFSFNIEKIDSTTSRVVVDISLNMPSSEMEFNLINGSSISFQLLFR